MKKHSFKNIMKFTFKVILSFILTFTCTNFLNFNNNYIFYTNKIQKAYATDLTDAQSEYLKAKNQLDTIQNEYKQEIEKASSIKKQINYCTEKAINTQSEKFKHQDIINNLAINEYKSNSAIMCVDLLFEANNIFDLLQCVFYSNKIIEDRISEINKQEQLRKEYANTISELNTNLEQYNIVSASLKQKLEKAQELVNSASDKLKNAENAEKLKRQAENISNQNNSSSEQGGSGDDQGGGDIPPKEWKNGYASAYGGISDPTASKKTATGDSITESSTGVAIPNNWPNYKSLFGHAVQIRYNGKTIIGIINDTGGFGSYGRDLDLQPGIFHSFGANSCQEWGIHNVEYIIL